MNSGKKTLGSMNQAVWYNQWTVDKFKQYLKGDILEVGCGIGNFTGFLNQYGKVWAIDVEKEYVIEIKQKLDGKVQVGIGDIEKGKYFFGNQKFDSIICLNVLEHIKNDTRALSNVYRLLKSGGKLILLVPSHQFLYGEIDRSIDHFRRYDKSKICEKLNEIGFKIIKSSRLNILGAIGWFVAGKVLKETVVKKGNIKIFNAVAPVLLWFENLIEPPLGISVLVIAQKVC